MLNRGEEDYIKAVYEITRLNNNGKVVANQQLVEFFGHTAQTVIEMIKKLDKQGYIEYTPYKGSALTARGQEIAIRLVRIHRIWEYFLAEKLGYTWDEVHEEAEDLEHVTSDRLIEKLYHFLQQPEFGPLGNPIPDLDGNLPNRTGESLWSHAALGKYKIMRVADDIQLLKYLKKLNIDIEKEIEIVSYDGFSEVMELTFEGSRITLGQKVADAIYVKKL